MKIIKAPNKIIKESKVTIFLAGSIEMGIAENWQQEFERELNDSDVLILSPRRDNWDSSWKQSIDNPNFYEQVTWELNAQDISDYIVMYFDPATKSPISLLELGLYASSGKLIVCCPEGFWRKGNVEIVCQKYSIPLFTNKLEFKKYIRQKITA